MNILDRYFLREFFKPLGLCLAAFLLCMVVYDLYDNITDFMDAHTPLTKILQYYVILIPAWLVQIIMPVSLLLSLLYVLSSMSKHGELTAMRASGLDFFRLMMPYFIVGICIAIQMLCLNLTWVPTAYQESKKLFEQTTGKVKTASTREVGVVYRDLAGNRSWFISILNPQDGEAREIEITTTDDRGRATKRISARVGYYRGNYWTFQDVIIYDYNLPISDPNVIQSLPYLEARNITESPQQFLVEAKKTKRMTMRELLGNLRLYDRLPPKQQAMYLTEFHNRYAYPISNFVVFLIGIPFGVVGQRRSNFLAVVHALCIFFLYMFLGQIMIKLGESGKIPAIMAAWTPNLLFAAGGLLMIRWIR
jgi:lipopolysaccharide export system permease protein